MNLFINIFKSTLGFYIQATMNANLSESENEKEGRYLIVINNYVGNDPERSLKEIARKIQESFQIKASEVSKGDIARVSFYDGNERMDEILEELRGMSLASENIDVLAL
ncbi:MAG: hypothetical protein JWM20_672 [Patescibacteria group bacterium]|nr:hypothetical protein [Patescibacteria group bacterium]